jgi:hypothetical protein
MSNKLRLDDIAFNDDELNDDYTLNSEVTNARRKTTKTKRKKQGSENYMHERSLKRGPLDNHEFH